MPLFRPTSGLFSESMAQVRDIETLDDFVEILRMKYAPKPFPPKISKDLVTIAPYGHDPRNGWDTYVVELKDYGVLGFTNGRFPSPTKESTLMTRALDKILKLEEENARLRYGLEQIHDAGVCGNDSIGKWGLEEYTNNLLNDPNFEG